MTSSWLLRSRTWLMRGGAVVILGALVGAWALSFAQPDEEEKPAPNVVQTEDPDDGRTYDVQRAGYVKKAKKKRADKPEQTEDAAETAVEQATDAATTAPPPSTTDPDPTPTGSDPTTPAGPKPTKPTKPPKTPGPSPNQPTNPPTQPGQECTDLISVINCVLDPITGRP